MPLLVPMTSPESGIPESMQINAVPVGIFLKSRGQIEYRKSVGLSELRNAVVGVKEIIDSMRDHETPPLLRIGKRLRSAAAGEDDEHLVSFPDLEGHLPQ